MKNSINNNNVDNLVRDKFLVLSSDVKFLGVSVKLTYVLVSHFKSGQLLKDFLMSTFYVNESQDI